EVVHRRPLGERYVFEIDHDLAPGASREARGVHREAVGDVRERVCDRGETAALLEPEGRPGVALLSESGAGGAERAGNDQEVAGSSAGAAGDAGGAAERGH